MKNSDGVALGFIAAAAVYGLGMATLTLVLWFAGAGVVYLLARILGIGKFLSADAATQAAKLIIGLPFIALCIWALAHLWELGHFTEILVIIISGIPSFFSLFFSVFS